MPISVVSICNRALDLLGADPITSLADGNRSARLCERHYEPTRDAVLRAYPWNGAMRRASLAALSEAPSWGFSRQYQLPVDCLRLWQIEEEGQTAWRIEGRRVLTDAGAPLKILYIAQIDDPSDFDPLLADALSARLAADLAYALTGSSSLQEFAWRVWQSKLTEARMADAQEGTPEELSANQWLESRA